MKIKCYDTLPTEAIEIRKSVFMHEQGFKDEFDEIDTYADHLVMFDNDEPIATCRVFKKPGNDFYMIGRIAVTKNYRGKHIGAELLKAAEKTVYQKKGKYVVLHAQLKAKIFYEKQGYFSYGKVECEEDCPHIWMYKKIISPY